MPMPQRILAPNATELPRCRPGDYPTVADSAWFPTHPDGRPAAPESSSRAHPLAKTSCAFRGRPWAVLPAIWEEVLLCSASATT